MEEAYKTMGAEVTIVFCVSGNFSAYSSSLFLLLSGENGKRGKMRFEEFKDKIVELLQDRLGECHKITVTKVLKNNDVRLTGIVIMREEDNISPTIYLEGPYRRYQAGVPVQKIAEEIIALYEEHACTVNLDMDFFRDFGKEEDRIFYKLINYEKNKTLLADVPWFRWHDLAVTFYYVIEAEAFGRASIMIHNNHLDMWGQSAEEIYRTAHRNMAGRMPELLVPIQKMLEEMIGRKLGEEEQTLYVLTNRDKLFGAAAMLYSEKIRQLADRLQTDLLILPSSIHEVLLIPEDRSREYLFYSRMVKEVNNTQVDPEEILSFNLYRYDRERAEIEVICSD